MYKDLKDMEGAGIVDGMSRFIPSSDKFFFPHSFLLKLNLSFLIIHGSIMLILWPFRLETVPIGGGKVLILLSLSLIFIKLEIVAGILLSLIHISEPTRLLSISYAVFCLKKKKKKIKRL